MDLKSQLIYLPKKIVNEIEKFENKKVILTLDDDNAIIKIGGENE